MIRVANLTYIAMFKVKKRVLEKVFNVKNGNAFRSVYRFVLQFLYRMEIHNVTSVTFQPRLLSDSP